MRCKNGSIMVEALISLVVISVAMSIIYIFPANLVELTRTVQIKSDIYDLAYSLAEKYILGEATAISNESTTTNNIQYMYSVESSKTAVFFDEKIYFATITVYPVNMEDKFKISINYTPATKTN